MLRLPMQRKDDANFYLKKKLYYSISLIGIIKNKTTSQQNTCWESEMQ